MTINVGILVFCQFFLTTDKIEIKEGEAIAPPREMVGRVINVKKEKMIRTEKRNNLVFAIEDEKTILEVEGTEPHAMHFFINSNACTAVQSKEDLQKQESELENKNQEIKKTNKLLIAKDKKEAIEKRKKELTKNKNLKVEDKKSEVEFMKDSKGHEIKVDLSDMNEFGYQEPTPTPVVQVPTPAPVYNYTVMEPSPTPEVTPSPTMAPAVEVIPADNKAKSKNNKNKVKVENSQGVSPDQSSDAGVKGIFKDIVNSFKKEKKEE